MAPRILLALCLVVLEASPALADRAADLKKLLADYAAAEAEFDAAELPPSPAGRIPWYKSYPQWTYLPKLVALAEADPSDAVALEASKLIVGENGRINLGCQWKPLFEAETPAWRILQEQQLTEEDCSLICLTAADGQSPAREAFLREMASRTDLPGDSRAFAMLGLAEYLAARSAEAEEGGFAAWSEPEDEYFAFLRTQLADEWIEYATVADPKPFRQESIELFRRVLDKYADVPVTITAPGFRDLKTIGDKARKSLHALEHLYVGAPAPDFDARDLDGNPLRLADYRGKVVLLSFWFTGCGPCMAMIPDEKALVEKFRDQPFALIGVCRDDDAAISKKTAAEHGMAWPSVHDGRPGPVTDAYNILSWPRFYLIDAKGRIASKNAPRDKLADAIADLLKNDSSSPSSASANPSAK